MIKRLLRWLLPRPRLGCPVCGGRGYKQTYIKSDERYCIGHGWWDSRP